MNINWTIGKRLAAAFGVLLIIQIIVGVIAYYDVGQLSSNIGLITHTDAVISGLDAIQGDLMQAESAGRGYIITGDENYTTTYQSAAKQASQDLADVRTLTADNASQQHRLDTLEPLVTTKLAFVQELIDLRKNDGFEAAQKDLINGKGQEAMNSVDRVIQEGQQEEKTLMITRNANANAAGQAIVWTIVLGTILAAVIILAAAAILTRNIADPLKALSGVAQQIANGNLSVTIPAGEGADEVGILTRAFRQMAETLRRYTADISQAASQLGSAASEILAATVQVASGTAETAISINETTTTVEQMRQAAQLSSQKAQNVYDSAQRVALGSQTGQKAVDETAIVMDRIREQMETIAQTVVRLSEQSQSIGGIIASVTDLADQSNLLAVNAAIEAAKAGEQGKGFAVVAQEIKSLAEQSKQATAQVRGILSEVQKATSSAVMATEQGSKAVEAGVKQGTQAGEATRVLRETSGEALQAAVQIATSSQQQVVGMDQIGVAMESINQAGSQNAGSMKQMENAVKNLHELGQKLKGLVEQFKV